jgi:hypothetical protein
MRTRSSLRSGFMLVLACPILLCITQCKSSGALSAEHCGGITCTSNSNCGAGAVLPLCAEPLSSNCHSVTHECVWKIKIDPACACIEHDVRLCTVSGGGTGVQICTANPGRTATAWATCQTTPACTP